MEYIWQEVDRRPQGCLKITHLEIGDGNPYSQEIERLSPRARGLHTETAALPWVKHAGGQGGGGAELKVPLLGPGVPGGAGRDQEQPCLGQEELEEQPCLGQRHQLAGRMLREGQGPGDLKQGGLSLRKPSQNKCARAGGWQLE